MEFSSKNTGVGCHFLLQRIFPTQGLNLGLPPCRHTLYCLSHQGNPGTHNLFTKLERDFGNWFDENWVVLGFVFLVCFWFCWVFCCKGFSLVVVRGVRSHSMVELLSCSWLCCWATWAQGHVGFTSCGSWAQSTVLVAHSMWNSPGSGLEPLSLALSGDSSPLNHQGSPALGFYVGFWGSWQYILT